MLSDVKVTHFAGDAFQALISNLATYLQRAWGCDKQRSFLLQMARQLCTSKYVTFCIETKAMFQILNIFSQEDLRQLTGQLSVGRSSSEETSPAQHFSSVQKSC